MYFRIFAENISNRIFNIVENECLARDITIRSVEKLFDKRVILCRCNGLEDLANIVSTLETDRDAFVICVKDSLGKNVNFRAIPTPEIPHYTRYNLQLCS